MVKGRYKSANVSDIFYWLTSWIWLLWFKFECENCADAVLFPCSISTTLNLWELHCATLSVHVEWLCSLCCSLAWLVILSLVYTFTFIVQNWGHSREHNRNGRKWAHLVWVSSYCYHANNMFLYFYFLWPCSCSGQQQIKHQNSRAIDTRAGIPACLPCVFCWNWYMLGSVVCGAYSRLQLYCAYGFSLSYALCKAGQYHFVLLKFSELI